MAGSPTRQRHIAYRRYDNKLTQIADLETAQAVCERFVRRKWVRVLKAFARRVNPLLATIRKAGLGDYYWTLHQAELATDVFFRDRTALEALLRFLGRKLHGNFQGQVTTDRKKRPQGCRVKHRMKGNSIKWYDALRSVANRDHHQPTA
jgi:hypothetical protein